MLFPFFQLIQDLICEQFTVEKQKKQEEQKKLKIPVPFVSNIHGPKGSCSCERCYLLHEKLDNDALQEKIDAETERYGIEDDDQNKTEEDENA